MGLNYTNYKGVMMLFYCSVLSFVFQFDIQKCKQ